MRPERARARRPRLALLLPLAVVCGLVAAICGGLLRIGVAVPGAGHLGFAAAWHGALMIGGVMGSVVAAERAVALKRLWAWLAPACSALAVPLLLVGQGGAAGVLLAAAGAVFCLVTLLLARRQPELHTALLLVAALCWFAGNLLWASGATADAVLPWWLDFLVITIAAERLEMTRLMRRRAGTRASLLATLALLLAGATASVVALRLGGVLHGAALLLLAAWLLRNDIARRTVHADGLPRYMAVCLLGGYAWLAIGGAAWIATALGAPLRDAAIHAVALGFIVGMVLGHAPVILPALTGIKVRFGRAFYLPLVALHLSLFARVVVGAGYAQWRAAGAIANALALLLFAATMVMAARAWRRDRTLTRINDAFAELP